MQDPERERERLGADGYVILEGVLTPSELEALSTAIGALERDRPFGRNEFEGTKSQRVYSLAGKGDVFLALAEHPRVVSLLDLILEPNWLLSTMQSIRLHPGETPQAWHTDDGFYLVPRPRDTLAISTIWAIEDFTPDNGATQLVPGSHRWGEQHPDAAATWVDAVMPAGSVLVFDAALWHRGGANHSSSTRLCISPQYCQPWLRPQESQLLIVPPAAARPLSPRARSMLGYSIHPPFVGQVDGMHPLRLVDPTYRSNKTGDRVVADELLVPPTGRVDIRATGRRS
jgi:ectoine hydroxylase-related dioxygenase (phytanoyl-CoA dioxygenase family)